MAVNRLNDVALGDIADFRNGKAISPERYNPHGKYPVFGSNGKIARTDDLLNAKPVAVIGRVGAYCGSVHYASEESWVTDNAIIASPKIGTDLRFLTYLLGSLQLQRTAIGSAQPLMTQSGLKIIRTKVPPLPEQKAIAGILGTLDEKIELNRRMNATLEAMARALFQSWFVDFHPVHAKAAGRQPTGMDEKTADLFPASIQDSALGEIPEGWTVETLENLASIRGGKQLPADDCHTTGPFPVFGANGVMGYAEQATHPEFVIAFGRVGAYCGSIHWALDGAWINNNASAVVPRRSGEYVLQAMLDIDFHSMRTGSAQPFIPNSVLASSKIIYPSQKIADAFSCAIAPIRRLQADNEKQSRTLTTLRDTLLPKLLSGEISVIGTSQ